MIYTSVNAFKILSPDCFEIFPSFAANRKWPIMINTKDYVKIVRKFLACLQAQKTGDDTPQLIFLLLDFLALHFSNLSLSLFNVLALFCFHLLAAGSEKFRCFWDFLVSEEMDWFPKFRTRQKSISLAIKCLANSKTYTDLDVEFRWVSLSLGLPQLQPVLYECDCKELQVAFLPQVGRSSHSLSHLARTA